MWLRFDLFNNFSIQFFVQFQISVSGLQYNRFFCGEAKKTPFLVPVFVQMSCFLHPTGGENLLRIKHKTLSLIKHKSPAFWLDSSTPQKENNCKTKTQKLPIFSFLNWCRQCNRILNIRFSWIAKQPEKFLLDNIDEFFCSIRWRHGTAARFRFEQKFTEICAT